MNLLLSFEQYKVLQESSKQFEKEIDSILTEGFGDVIGSPIKYVKLKNNSKKYQKALLKKALNDVDYAKKLEKGAKDLSAEQKEVLKQANKAKNTALADKAGVISQRMTDLATNDGLKQVEKLAKSKAKIAAAETTLKAATGQEMKSLKLKISKLKGAAADASQELADYEKEGGDDEGKDGGKKEKTKEELAKEAKEEKIEAQKETVQKIMDEYKTFMQKVKEHDKTKPKDKDGDWDAYHAKKDELDKTRRGILIKQYTAELTLANLEEDKDQVKKLTQDIEDSKAYLKNPDNFSKKKEEVKEDPKKEDMGEKEKERLEKAEKILKSAQEAGDEEKIAKAEKTIKSLKDTVLKKEGEDPMEDLRNEINEKAVSLMNESVKDKFARLLNEKRSV